MANDAAADIDRQIAEAFELLECACFKYNYSSSIGYLASSKTWYCKMFSGPIVELKGVAHADTLCEAVARAALAALRAVREAGTE